MCRYTDYAGTKNASEYWHTDIDLSCNIRFQYYEDMAYHWENKFCRPFSMIILSGKKKESSLYKRLSFSLIGRYRVVIHDSPKGYTILPSLMVN